jgi:CelD/BcsL family acetyltransferase involved in cellulose biosynthesis
MAMKLVRLESVGELREQAGRWDDLWRRSETPMPTVRAELLAQWIEQFAADRRFLALAVESEGELVAALPLVAEQRAWGGLVARLPRNVWTDGGELLVDAHAPEESLHLLANGLRRLPWAVIHGEGLDADSPWWRRFLNVLRSRGHASAVRTQFEVGLIDLVGEWDAYEASLSGNHRRAVRKSLRKLEAVGPVELATHSNATSEGAAVLFERLCQVEDKSWKGEAGTSILRTPGMLPYFQRQARQLAEWGCLEIFFVEQHGRALAAEYGFGAKGVYYPHKIAYDPEFSSGGPGRLLRYLQLQRYFANSKYHLVDTLGILSDANAKWSTRRRRSCRLLLSTGGFLGNRLVDAYHRVWPSVKKLIGRNQTPPAAKLGAEEFAASAQAEEQPSEVGV